MFKLINPDSFDHFYHFQPCVTNVAAKLSIKFSIYDLRRAFLMGRDGLITCILKVWMVV